MRAPVVYSCSNSTLAAEIPQIQFRNWSRMTILEIWVTIVAWFRHPYNRPHLGGKLVRSLTARQLRAYLNWQILIRLRPPGGLLLLKAPRILSAEFFVTLD